MQWKYYYFFYSFLVKEELIRVFWDFSNWENFEY